MKQIMIKQPVAILSIMLFSVAIMLSGNTNATRDMATQAELNAAVAQLKAKINALTPPKRAIGDRLPGGGIVFWVDSTGRHGLAVSGDDQATTWYQAHTQVTIKGFEVDWRLPTLRECEEMTENKDAIFAGFGEAHFSTRSWTSAEIDATTVWECDISTGVKSEKSKDHRDSFVLPIRRF